MLEWFTGVLRSQNDIPPDEGLHSLYWRNSMANLLTSTADNNQSVAEEPPETPAPLFAVRALKSALFGTPALEEDEEEDDDIQVPTIQHVSTERFNRPLSPARFPAVSNDNLVTQKSKIEALLSPAKGILLTPGTGAARRKTVSFGALADFNEGLTKAGLSQNGESTDHKSAKSPRSGGRLHGNRQGEIGLRRSLFNAQGKRSGLKLPEGGLEEEDQPIMNPVDQTGDLVDRILTDGLDVTVDLKHPISRSGQHWKKEYQRDHENSKKEMRKLIHYTQAAKSYAIKRDTEALSLSEKLKQALTRSAEMETRVSLLASQLSQSAGQQKRVPSDQNELLGELAAQTASSLRYKQKAERYRMAIQAQSTFATGEKELLQSQKSNTASGDLQASVPQAKPQADRLESDSVSEGEEMLQLRNVAEMAENKAAVLVKENVALKNTLARVKQEMKAYEIRHQAREQRRKKKDEKAEAQRLALREELAKYRTMHQQKTENIPSRNSMGKIDSSRTTPPKASIHKQHTVVDNLNERYHHFALPQQDENVPRQLPNTLQRRKLGSTTETSSLPKPWNEQDMKSSSPQGSVDIWATSVDELKSTSPRDASLVYDKSPLAELKHLMNEGHGHRVRERPTAAETSEKKITDSKPSEQFLDGVPARPLPNLEPESAAPLGFGLASDYEEVPRQIQRIMDGISKSSEVHFQVRPHGSLPSQSRSNTLSRLLGNSRASSLSERPPLPPDRAEAARKRLEQKTKR